MFNKILALVSALLNVEKDSLLLKKTKTVWRITLAGSNSILFCQFVDYCYVWTVSSECPPQTYCYWGFFFLDWSLNSLPGHGYCTFMTLKNTGSLKARGFKKKKTVTEKPYNPENVTLNAFKPGLFLNLWPLQTLYFSPSSLWWTHKTSLTCCIVSWYLPVSSWVNRLTLTGLTDTTESPLPSAA